MTHYLERTRASDAQKVVRPDETDPNLADVTRLLGQMLGPLGQDGSQFQATLEARLVARLHEHRDPWWRRLLLSPAAPGAAARRWRIVGLATAAMLVVATAAVALVGIGPREASAAEILEKAQLSFADPFSAGVKSFHLMATSSGRLPLADRRIEGEIEQWYQAPNRTRTHTRTREPDGSTTVSGIYSDDKTMKVYVTPGKESHVISVLPRGGIMVFLHREGPPPAEARPGEKIRIAEGRSDEDFTVCLKPERKGEATIAGRKVYVIEHRPCDGESTSEALSGRHVLWVDQESYLPLKTEDYDADGKLRFRYEVTRLQYDANVSDSVFENLPPSGTVIQHEGPSPRLGIEERQERVIRRKSPS